MKEKIIEKKRFGELIESTAKNYKFFGPVEEDGNVVFQDLSSSGKITFDYLNARTNPKGLFFPQSEVLFHFKKDEVTSVPRAEEKFVVFGIRPCDVQGLLVVDQVYLSDDFTDVYYLGRRENGTIITLACQQPCPTCFCAGVGGGPAREDGSDVLASDTGEKVVLKPLTKKGDDFIKDCGRVLKAATRTELARVEKQAKEAAKKMAGEFDLARIKKILDKNFNHELWKNIHRKCIGCGICTYLCPTCYCFDITDEMRGAEGRRLKSWDSCMFRLFTLHASGHNPRLTGKERFRQRVMHKFKYLEDNCRVTGCTGCGRCVRECPVNLDIREVLNEILKIKA